MRESVVRASVLGLVLAAAPVWAQTPSAKSPPAPEATQKAKSVDLSPKWTVGRVDRFSADIERNDEVSVEGREDLHQDLPATRRVIFSRKVLQADAEKVVVEITYERASVDSRSGGIQVSLDSTKPAPSGDEALLLDLMMALNRPLAITFGPKGELVSVAGRDPQSSEDLGPMAKTFLGDTFLMSLLDALHGPHKFPGTTAAGEWWELQQEIPLQMPGKLVVAQRRSLADTAGPRATIELSGAAVYTPVEGAGITEARVEGVKISGQVLWNTAEGVLDEHTSDQKTELAFSAQGMKARIKNHTLVRIKRLPASTPAGQAVPSPVRQ